MGYLSTFLCRHGVEIIDSFIGYRWWRCQYGRTPLLERKVFGRGVRQWNRLRRILNARTVRMIDMRRLYMRSALTLSRATSQFQHIHTPSHSTLSSHPPLYSIDNEAYSNKSTDGFHFVAMFCGRNLQLYGAKDHAKHEEMRFAKMGCVANA